VVIKKSHTKVAIFSRSVAFFPLHVCAPALCDRWRWPFFYGSRAPSCDGAFSVDMYEASYAPPFVKRVCAQNLVCYDAPNPHQNNYIALRGYIIYYLPSKSQQQIPQTCKLFLNFCGLSLHFPQYFVVAVKNDENFTFSFPLLLSRR